MPPIFCASLAVGCSFNFLAAGALAEAELETGGGALGLPRMGLGDREAAEPPEDLHSVYVV